MSESGVSGMTLENGEILQVKNLIEESQSKCPIGLANQKELEHMKKSIESVESVQDLMFARFEKHGEKMDEVKTQVAEKIDAAEKQNSSRWFSFMGMLIVELIGLFGGLLFIVLKLNKLGG